MILLLISIVVLQKYLMHTCQQYNQEMVNIMKIYAVYAQCIRNPSHSPPLYNHYKYHAPMKLSNNVKI